MVAIEPVADRLLVEQSPLHDRPAHSHVWFPILDAVNRPILEQQSREDAVDGRMELIRTRPGLNRGHTASGLAEVCRVAACMHINRIHGLDRHDDAGLASRRVGLIESVHDERARRGRSAADADPIVRSADDGWHQRQHVLVTAIQKHGVVDDRPRNRHRGIRLRWTEQGRGSGIRGYGDAVLKRCQHEAQIDGRQVGLNDDIGAFGNLKTREFGSETVAAFRSGKRVLAVLIGDARNRRRAGSVQKCDDHAGKRCASGIGDPAVKPRRIGLNGAGSCEQRRRQRERAEHHVLGYRRMTSRVYDFGLQPALL